MLWGGREKEGETVQKYRIRGACNGACSTTRSECMQAFMHWCNTEKSRVRCRGVLLYTCVYFSHVTLYGLFRYIHMYTDRLAITGRTSDAQRPDAFSNNMLS